MQVNDFNVSYAESNGDGDNAGPNMSFVQSIYSSNAKDQLLSNIQSNIDKRSIVLGRSSIAKEDFDN